MPPLPRSIESKTSFRAVVEPVPASVSWKILKEFFRDAASVVFADVLSNGRGIVDFASETDMAAGIEKMNGADLRGQVVRVFKVSPM